MAKFTDSITAWLVPTLARTSRILAPLAMSATIVFLVATELDPIRSDVFVRGDGNDATETLASLEIRVAELEHSVRGLVATFARPPDDETASDVPNDVVGQLLAMEKQIETIHSVMLNAPERMITIPLIRGDIESLREADVRAGEERSRLIELMTTQMTR